MLLTTKQAQKLFNLSRPTLYKRAREGAIRAEKIGGVWRYDPRELTNLKEEDYKK